MRKHPMLRLAVILAVAAVVAGGPAHAGTLEEARKAADSGDLETALSILEKIVADDPADADALAYLGLYTGMSAGQAKDYMEAGRLTMKSFELLDRSIELDGDNAKAYFFRGVMGVNVPDFLGRLDGGIKDLEKAVSLYSAMPGEEGREPLVAALQTLAEGHAKKGDQAGQRAALEMLIGTAPGSEAAKKASVTLGSLDSSEAGAGEVDTLLSPSGQDDEETAGLRRSLAEDPEDTGLMMKLARALYSSGRYEEASSVLKRYTGTVDDDAEAWKLLAMSISMIAAPGYDENIHEDTNYRSRLALEAMQALDKAVGAAPEDTQLRLTRGIYGVTFPFFLGKFEQGVADLEMVAGSDAPREAVAEANYYLGLARQKEAMRYWIKVAREFEGTEAESMVYETMRPKVARIDVERHEKPFVMVDFVLSFEDELAPQTAVWVEGPGGDYVATLYVSGFAGKVKEVQVTLPRWARGSGFEGIDAVTGPSINTGHHIYTWDLTDHEGDRVADGTYTVKVETLFWPSMKYQIVGSSIDTGGRDQRVVAEEGDLIPRLELRYYGE